MNPKQTLEPNELWKGESVLGHVLWAPLVFLFVSPPDSESGHPVSLSWDEV